MSFFWKSVFIFFLVITFSIQVKPTFAQTPQHQEQILKAKVIDIIEEGQKQLGDQPYLYQVVKLQLFDETNSEITITHGETSTITEKQKVEVGQIVVVMAFTPPESKVFYQIIDTYRLPTLGIYTVLFIILVLSVGRMKGLGSLVGLAISLLIIIQYIIPQIMSGTDPVMVSVIGSLAILTVTLYLAHGFSIQTTTALVSTYITLGCAVLISSLFVNGAQLSGLGGEDSYALKFGQTSNLNFSGLLLGGIIIGALGILDDVTTTQSATVFELFKTDPRLSFSKLFSRAMNVGREHIASLVNTLALAYTGASLPIFLLLLINPTNYPLWFLLNSEFLAEEIARTLSGSIALILAIPISTLLATMVCKKYIKPSSM